MTRGGAKSILVAGASGRLGTNVLRRLGEQGLAANRFGARADDPGSVGGGGDASPASLAGVDAVINCAGLSRGSLQQLEQANVCFAEKLARASKQAGVRHFVQVSSFSVFGRVDQIGPASALRPDSAYGCSKLLAERRLAALAADGFEVTILRLPFMFSAEHPGLLRPLLRGMRRFRIMPARVGGQPLKRSMITFDDAAALLVGLVWAPHRGVLSAADPEPLALSRLAELARHHWGCSIALLPTPRALASVIGLVSPRIGNSLLKSSVLEASINYLGGERGSRVENELAAYFGGRDGPIAPL